MYVRGDKKQPADGSDYRLIKNKTKSSTWLRGGFPRFFDAFSHQHEEDGELRQEGDDPGDGVGEVEALQRVEAGLSEDGEDPEDPEHADAQHADDHGQERRADAPDGPGGYVHDAAEEIGQAYVGQADHAVGDGVGGIGDVDGEQRPCQRPAQHARGKARDGDAGEADQQDLVDALVFSRAVVLPAEVQRRLMEGVHGDVDKALDVL